MRRLASLIAVLALTSCGGGSNGTSTLPGQTVSTSAPAPSPTPTGSSTSSKSVTPTFRITIPARTGSAKSRRPNFISSGTMSISIALTAVNGSSPGVITGNPAITSINSTTCSSGCTVNGSPSPAGSDTFVLTTYDGANATGNALNTGTGTYTLVEGQNNSETITLNGIPASIAMTGVPAFAAGPVNSVAIGGPGSSAIAVSVLDADGETITGTYAHSVTFSDPDTNGEGSLVAGATCSPSYPAGNPTVAATSVTLSSDTSSAIFCYGGLAENPVVLTAGAPGATTASSSFIPQLNAPTYVLGSGTPPQYVTGNPPDIQLDAPNGPGSTASVLFAESGWTNAPYNQYLYGGPVLAIYCSPPVSGPLPFTITPIYTPSGTQITVW